MILPIYAYGHDALRAETHPVTEDSDALQQLIDDMIETMHAAAGIGLAAPQVGRTERLFVVDVSALADDFDEPLPPQPMVCINPKIVDESEATVEYEEGCLSIPEIREAVTRPEQVRLQYLDRSFAPQEYAVGEFLARVIQHEYDHLEGVLFTDYLSSFRKRLLKRRLRRIAEGDVDAGYPLVARDGSTVEPASQL
ncbi:peptide deformylase [Salisaeta longa]|uniref:peptide deformylase n=1 Tax=Salisaeta longa TaxID=503170 RepID=UPI0003B610E7|nr:peptide deformylase [Salisaeta longa]